MKIWKDNTSRADVLDLTEKAQAVFGLWLVGTTDPDEIVKHLPGKRDGLDRSHVKALLRSRHPVILKIKQKVGVWFWVEIKGSVRCKGCGQKVFFVPCRICDANATQIWYTADKVSAKECRPTAALPGTPQKLRVLKERANKGQNLWHPEDAKWPQGSPCKVLHRNEPLFEQPDRLSGEER